MQKRMTRREVKGRGGKGVFAWNPHFFAVVDNHFYSKEMYYTKTQKALKYLQRCTFFKLYFHISVELENRQNENCSFLLQAARFSSLVLPDTFSTPSYRLI